MNIELREWDITYIDSLAEIANNKKIANNLRNGYPNPYTIEDAKWFIEDTIQKGEDKQLFRAIFADGELAGGIGLTFKDDIYEKSAELGYWLGEEHWGKGIVTEAIKQICETGFNNYDIIRIFAEPFYTNMGSRRVLEKNGFKLEGVLEKNVYKNGQVLDSCIYAILKEKWRIN